MDAPQGWIPCSALIPVDQAENKGKASLITAWVENDSHCRHTEVERKILGSGGQEQLEKSLGVINAASVNASLSTLLGDRKHILARREAL